MLLSPFLHKGYDAYYTRRLAVRSRTIRLDWPEWSTYAICVHARKHNTSHSVTDRELFMEDITQAGQELFFQITVAGLLW